MLAAARTPPALCSIRRREITCLGVLLMAEHCRRTGVFLGPQGGNGWACRHPQFGRQECLQDLTQRLGLLDARKQGGQSHVEVVLCGLDAANGNSVRGWSNWARVEADLQVRLFYF